MKDKEISDELLKYLTEAMEQYAKEFGYTLFTLRPNCNWDISQIDPARLYEYGKNMFMKGANAVVKITNGLEKKTKQ